MCHWSEMPKHCKQRRMALKCWGKNKRLNVMLRYNPNSKLCWQRVNWDRVELISGSGDVASFFFFNGMFLYTDVSKKKKKKKTRVCVGFVFLPPGSMAARGHSRHRRGRKGWRSLMAAHCLTTWHVLHLQPPRQEKEQCFSSSVSKGAIPWGLLIVLTCPVCTCCWFCHSRYAQLATSY